MRAASFAAPLAVALLLVGLLTPSVAAAECTNELLRAENNSGALPDCRAYELVSPVDKNGGGIPGFGASSGGGVLQGAAEGGAFTYSSAASFENPEGAPAASQSAFCVPVRTSEGSSPEANDQGVEPLYPRAGSRASDDFQPHSGIERT